MTRLTRSALHRAARPLTAAIGLACVVGFVASCGALFGPPPFSYVSASVEDGVVLLSVRNESRLVIEWIEASFTLYDGAGRHYPAFGESYFTVRTDIRIAPGETETVAAVIASPGGAEDAGGPGGAGGSGDISVGFMMVRRLRLSGGAVWINGGYTYEGSAS